MDKAVSLNCDYVATGHYVRKDRDASTGRWLIKRAADLTKDQSYMLYSLTQSQIARSLFPLGDLSKEEVRRIARSEGLSCADSEESQDICLCRRRLRSFYRKVYREVFPSGKYIGKTGELELTVGLLRYTIGQRRVWISSDKRHFCNGKKTQTTTLSLSETRVTFQPIRGLRRKLVAIEQPGKTLGAQLKRVTGSGPAAVLLPIPGVGQVCFNPAVGLAHGSPRFFTRATRAWGRENRREKLD
jgi:tRNA U34 2-thiouridine synthase MnmA/TrmU